MRRLQRTNHQPKFSRCVELHRDDLRWNKSLLFSTFQPIPNCHYTPGKIVTEVVFPKAKNRKTLGL